MPSFLCFNKASIILDVVTLFAIKLGLVLDDGMMRMIKFTQGNASMPSN